MTAKRRSGAGAAALKTADFKQTQGPTQSAPARMRPVSADALSDTTRPDAVRGATLELVDVAYHYSGKRGQRPGLGPISLKSARANS